MKFNTKRTIVIINEQHQLMDSQKRMLMDKFKEFSEYKVPANGWSVVEQLEIIDEMKTELHDNGLNIVFASPVPVLLGKLAFLAGSGCDDVCEQANACLQGNNLTVFVLHNNRCDEKELPGGKIIFTVAQDGWKIVQI